jgi:hypothetical protein
MALHGTAQRLAHNGGEVASRCVAEEAPERLEVLLHARVHGDAKRPLFRGDGAQLGGAAVALVGGAAVAVLGGAAVALVGGAAVAVLGGAGAHRGGQQPSSDRERTGAGELVRRIASPGERL